MRDALVLLVILAACHAKPKVYLPTTPPAEPERAGETETATTTTTTSSVEQPAGHTTTTASGRQDFTVAALPISLAIYRGALVWADLAGAVWTMPADGGRPKELTEQHRDGFVFHPFVAGGRVLAKIDKDLLEIAIPDGPAKRLHVRGIDGLPEEAVGNDSLAFITMFKHTVVLQIAGGVAKHLLDVQRGVLCLHGDTLYVASYTTGELRAVPIAGGAPRVVAKNLARPTALAADDHTVYVHTEKDHRVIRIDVASGTEQTLGENLENADVLVLDGTSLYTMSWPKKLVRLATTPGTAPVVLADDLDEPRSIAVDDRFVYVTTGAPPRIVKIPKR